MLPESYSDLLNKGNFPFLPGMSASADIQTKTHKNVISIPINAVTTREKSDSTKTTSSKTENSEEDNNTDDLDVVVFTLTKEKTVKKVIVKTDIQDINYIEVTKGLAVGDEVITGPYEVVSKLLKEKDKVKVVDKKDLFEIKK